MTDEVRDKLHLSIMENVLPIGVAMVDRVRKGGPKKIFETFLDSDQPLQILKEEGESGAKSVRDRLDQLSPGLGNPVVSVTVDVNNEDLSSNDIQDKQALIKVLGDIQSRLDLLEQYLSDDSFELPIN